jgi:hypothetical protein
MFLVQGLPVENDVSGINVILPVLTILPLALPLIVFAVDEDLEMSHYVGVGVVQ